jgi:CBS domain containing-hemolysin-like protein
MSLLLVVVLVLLNAIFVAAELALVTARRTRIDQLASSGNRFARQVRRAMDHPLVFIAGTQVGITLASLLLGWIGEPAFAGLIESLIVQLPGLQALLPEHVLTIGATVLAFFFITLLTIVFGEVVPKSVAIYRAETVAQFTVPPVQAFAQLARPLIWLVNSISQLILQLFGLQARAGRHTVHSEEEITALIAESRQAGVVNPEEEELVRRVFRFGDRVAREVMVPRTRIRAIPLEASLDEAVTIQRGSGHSRLPVFDGDLDNIVGVVTASDLLMALGRQPPPTTVGEIMRPADYIPESKELGELLPEMRARRTQLVVVLDEYGGTAGILTIEDLVEEVVGEIVSEFGSERRLIHRQTDAELVVDAELNLDDLNDLWGLQLPLDEVDTVGGFVYQQLGHVPKVGEQFSHDGLLFSVRSMRGNAIGAVRITRAADTE